MSGTARKLTQAALLAIVAAALAFYVFEGPSWNSLLTAFLLILAFTPMKGLIYRRLGGAKPYASALAANASSELAGLPFHLALSFWALMGVSFLVSSALETLALVSMGTVPSLRRSLLLALYGCLVIHLIMVGWFVWEQSLAVAISFFVAGVVLFHLPALFPGWSLSR